MSVGLTLFLQNGLLKAHAIINIYKCYQKTIRHLSQLPKISLSLHEEVKDALETRKPVVALESTIITHGMPYPDNIKCAFEVEALIREEGAVPATIGILKGTLRAGLSEKEIEFLGDTKSSEPIKTSRRDLAYVISHRRNGGTTVSGTIIFADKVGIPIFATGGIGGVHRGAEKSLDISADLTELGRSNIAVISSGVKSILDIPKTLQYLETQGVFVATFGSTRDFPAFYTRVSGCQSPYCIQTSRQAAQIIKTNRDLNLQSGMLFAVPIPEMFSLDSNMVNNVIEEAIKDAKSKLDVLGKEVTPFLLKQVAKLTGGKSLEANIALIKNNAETAARIACELAKLESDGSSGEECSKGETRTGRPVVIGGSVLDCSATLDTTDIKLDGRIHDGKFSYSAGGVGRNICEALCKLGFPPHFISTVGDDEPGKLLQKLIPTESRQSVKVLKGNTAQCIIVFDKKGECRLLMGDMKIHKEITPEMITRHENLLRCSPLVVLDANLTVESMSTALEIASKYKVPVLFEPTDVEISNKPFRTNHWKAIKIITPNLNELKFISSFLNISRENDYSSKIQETADISKKLVKFVDNVIVTMGPEGIIVARRGHSSKPFLVHESHPNVSVRHYPVVKIKNFVNVSGAGDCLASGVAAGIIKGLSEEECVAVGFKAAQAALWSSSAVPSEMFGTDDVAWKNGAEYKTLY